MLSPLLSDANAPLIGLLGFLVTLLGFAATIYGLKVTFDQAKGAAEAAEQATAAVEAFKARSRKRDASRDVAVILNALEETVRHLEGQAWRNAVISYEAARRGVIRLQVNDEIPDEKSKFLPELSDHILSFCEVVDLAESKKGEYPNISDVSKYIRNCYTDFAKMDAFLVRDI